MTVYFTLEDKSELSNFESIPSVLKPEDLVTLHITDKIDATIAEIYKELYDRSFQVSGIEAEFSVSTEEDGKESIIKLHNIKHDDFVIDCFSRTYVNFMYPKREIRFYNDTSPVTVYTYVGEDWEADKYDFFNNSKVNSKLQGLKKTYIEYRAERGSDVFEFNDDLGREYSPEGDEPTTIKKSTEINKLYNFLLSLLDELKSLPKSEFDQSVFDYNRTLLAEPLKLKSFYDTYDYEFDFLKPTGKRFISLGNNPGGEYSNVYTNGFIYGEIPNDQTEATSSKKFIYGDKSKLYEVDLELKYSDQIYVVDLDPSENLLESYNTVNKFNLFGDSTQDVELTEEVLAERQRNYYKALVSKYVKIEDYDGSFIKPLYLINRIIRQDEIISIKKCKTKEHKMDSKLLNELLEGI